MKKSEVKFATDYIIRNEDETISGVVENDPVDPGGLTKWGITQRSYAATERSGNVADLSLQEAEAWYAKHYLKNTPCSLLGSIRVATKIADHAVNMGCKHAYQCAQRAVNQHDDGILGQASISAINQTPDAAFFLSFQAQLKLFYKRIVALNPSQSRFIDGWLNRVKKLPGQYVNPDETIQS